jgi:hypothetical protein
MASIDVDDYARPRNDSLGLGLFSFHLGVGAYILTGWMIPSYPALIFYLIFVPLVALQWWVNRGSCILNNLESRLRFGRWRAPQNHEEGGFLRMIATWAFGVKPAAAFLDRTSYGTMLILWLAGFVHLKSIFAF